jgi:hypothetical protein
MDRGANGAGECHGGGTRKTLDTLREPRRITQGALASERVRILPVVLIPTGFYVTGGCKAHLQLLYAPQ